MTYNISGVPAVEATLLWPYVRCQIEQGIVKAGHGEYTAGQLLKKILQKEMQLFIIGGEDHEIWGAVITEMALYPNLKVCRIVLLVGERLADWADLEDYIISWARKQGCTRLEASVRPGLNKVSKKYGYKKIYDVIAKEIDPIVLQ